MATGMTNAKGAAGTKGNYAMLFYKGGHEDQLTGGYTRFYNVGETELAMHMAPDLYLYCPEVSDGHVMLRTNQPVNMSDYEKLCYYAKTGYTGVAFCGVYTTREIQPYTTAGSGAPGTNYVIGSKNVLRLPYSAAGVHSAAAKDTGWQYVYLCAGSAVRVTISAVWLAGADNWRALCNIIGVNADNFADETALFNDYSSIRALFDNAEAMEYLRTCTGTTLTAFINSSMAMTALKKSIYAPVLAGDPHWSKFLAMLA